jgi:hypothetical protein
MITLSALKSDLRKVESSKIQSLICTAQPPGIPLEYLLFIRALVDHRREEVVISPGGDISRC